MRNRLARVLIAGAAIVATAPYALAASAGHYLPGVYNIRDWGNFPQGLYFEQYNVWYKSSDLKGPEGNSVGSIEIGGQPVMISPNVNIAVFAPILIWATGKKFLGADYTVEISPQFGQTGVGARLNVLNSNREFGAQQFGMGDLFVQPLNLTWHNEKFAFTPSYAFYAPTGTYTAGAHDNVGLGFWSHDFAGSLYYYPKPDQSTAIMLTTLYEIHTNKSGEDFKPGNQWGLEYGWSQYLSHRLELGVSGFHAMQVSHDEGTDAKSPTVLNRISGVGPQATYWLLKERLSLAARVMWDYGVEARFNGTTANFSLTYVIKAPH